MRRLAIAGAGVVLIAWWLAAHAAVPTGCSGTGVDNFQAVGPGDRLVSTMWNQLMCAMNGLQTRAMATPRYDTSCSPVTLAPGNRAAVNLLFSVAITGNEAIFIDVKDTGTPARLVADGFEAPAGNAVKAYVWNRDAEQTHVGRVCAKVVRS